MDQADLFRGAAATPKQRRERQKMIKAAADARASFPTLDSFQNFQLNIGLGTDNALTGSTYGFNPVTRIRTLLEWIYRGSWMGAVAVDIIADDMTRAGVEIEADDLEPDDIEKLEREITQRGVWTQLNDTCKWGRLYGGSVGVIMIDGQDLRTPLRTDTIRPGQFKGIAVFDRWCLTPSSRIVTEFGPDMGNPEFYTIDENAPGLRNQTVHYSRCIRMVGIELPWQQKIAENLWGLSVIERLYDRMIAFDSATQGAAQLIYRSATRTYKVNGMRQLLASGAGADQILMAYADMVRKYQSIEGMALIDAEDDLVTTTVNVQSGISDALTQFGQQISGCLQIPLTRLFGQSPAGLNSTGESDLRTYYDGIKNQQNKELREGVLKIYKCAARSLGMNVSPKFTIEFRSLWQLTDQQKAEIAEKDARTVADLFSAGIIDKATALKELRQVGKIAGRFQNITDEMIEAAKEEAEAQAALPPDAAALLGGNGGPKMGPEDQKPKLIEPKDDKAERRAKVGDSYPLRDYQGFQIAIETPKGDVRHGAGWAVEMPADYGFIRGTSSAEGRFEQMDVFVGPIADAPIAFVIDGQTPGGGFDEHKVMMGFASQDEAVSCFRSAYHDARIPMGVTPLPLAELRRWLDAGRGFDRPLSQRAPMLVATR